MSYLDNSSYLPQFSQSTNNENFKVIAIIPALNESLRISEIVNEVKKYVNTVIVVDDGSTDDTFEKALQPRVKVIRNNRNRGKGVALKRGLIESLQYRPDIIVTIDADGQHDPKDIPRIIKPIKDGLADMVIGSRYNSQSINEVPLIRGVGLSIIYILNKTLTRINVKDTQSGFRAYGKSILGTIGDYECTGYGAETEQLAQAELYGFNIMEIPVTIKYKGLSNTSKQNPFTHGVHLISTILKLTVEKRPLLFFGLGGLILILISLIPLANLLGIFNETRYFSIPLALIVLGFSFIGSLLIVISFVLYSLKRIRISLNQYRRQ
ncbi:MAG: glycosyltransferase family 2 protein [Candidatus Nitrosocosmicus sp.]|nr:glycosyltransferase family 2 protein [Candidatus Nitrosocosmicus sp.]